MEYLWRSHQSSVSSLLISLIANYKKRDSLRNNSFLSIKIRYINSINIYIYIYTNKIGEFIEKNSLNK